LFGEFIQIAFRTGAGKWGAMAGPLSQLRLLIVDDNKQMRTIVGSVLSAAGVGHIHYAQDGRDALGVMDQFPIDCVYVDHEMPVMNGLDFISRVRAQVTQGRFMPLIMLSGHSELAKLNAARDRGATEFLRKPVTPKDILLRLQAVIMQPRMFVSSDSYFGPDRRRRRLKSFAGPFRRNNDCTGLLEV
jgi:two-component system, chemotaxis family, chemotaxis protein CheY